MTLPTNEFSSKLEAIYGPEWRTKCPEDIGYTYEHLWAMMTGKSKVPKLLERYIEMRLSRKRPNAGRKKAKQSRRQ